MSDDIEARIATAQARAQENAARVAANPELTKGWTQNGNTVEQQQKSDANDPNLKDPNKK